MNGRRVALVTGAVLMDDGIGIGGATAEALVRHGLHVVAADLNYAGAERLAQHLDTLADDAPAASALEVDMADGQSVREMVDHTVSKFGRLDVLVNNAGAAYATDTDVVNMDTTAWDNTFAIDVRGIMLATKYALPSMIENGSGAVINVSSINALMGDALRTAFGAAKAAVNALTLYTATQYGPSGIRCNAVCPGMTDTAALRRLLPTQVRDILLRHIPAQRPCSPAEVAAVIAFLASDAASGINGEVITVDGGMTSHLPFYADMRSVLASAAVTNV